MSISKSTTFTAGLTLNIRLSYGQYPASTWQGTLLLRGPSSVDIAATAEDDVFVFYADAVATEKWQPGKYWFSVRGASGDEIVEMQSGEVTIATDIANAPEGYDGRSYAERVLAAVECVIEKRAAMDQQSYRINDRELIRTPIADLLELRERFRAEVELERAAADGAIGA